jgi:hypothetical protein
MEWKVIVSAAEMKLPPCIVSKMRTLKKEHFPSGIIISPENKDGGIQI